MGGGTALLPVRGIGRRARSSLSSAALRVNTLGGALGGGGVRLALPLGMPLPFCVTEFGEWEVFWKKFKCIICNALVTK